MKWFSPNIIDKANKLTQNFARSRQNQQSLALTSTLTALQALLGPSQALLVTVLKPSQALLRPLKALSASTSLSLSGLALAGPLLKLSRQNSKLCEI
jgi:hypothetical protein